MKLLTISIAAYHVEKYLGECLDSFAYKDLQDKLEVLVINDGSGEGVNKIARGYEEKYPKIFRLIDKENGGHGSTINRGIQEASGKYFKTVDGDDAVTEKGLRALLACLEDTNVDMIITNYDTFDDDSGSVLEHIDCCTVPNTLDNKNVSQVNDDICELTKSGTGCTAKEYMFQDVCNDMYFVMHAITYRTELLREHKIKLDHHCFYVDAEYCLYPILWVKTVAFVNETVYRYRMGLTTQSMDILNMQKNCTHHEKVLLELLNYYREHMQSFDEASKRYFEKGIAKILVSQIKIYLSFPTKKEYKQRIISWDTKIRQEYPCVYQAVVNKSVWMLRKSHYHIYCVASWLCRRKYQQK